MEDELEDKLIYQIFVIHFKLLAKLIMSISISTTCLNYTWRLIRIYIFKPEVLIISIITLILITYLQNTDFRSESVFKKLRLSFNESSISIKNVQDYSKSNHLSWEYKTDTAAVFAVQGRRPHMEDRFVICENITDTGVSLFAVFDGHGGEFAADFASENLIDALKNRIIEIKTLIKNKKYVKDSKLTSLKPENTQVLTTEDKKLKLNQCKSKIMYSDDMRKIKNINLDSDIAEKIEKFLPVTKDPILIKLENVPSIKKDAHNYLQPLENINYNKLLTDEVLAIDKLLVEAARKTMNIAGTTALIALMEKNQLIVANVGDSRGVMCDSKGNVIPLSFDHKPQQMREKKRIQEAGGFISFNGVWRVAGILATSRALGDYPLKDRNLVIADPDILTFDLSNHKPQFLIFASDGLWDMFTNEEAVAFIKDKLNEPLFGAKSITLQAYYKGSLDNITVIIINLANYKWFDSKT